MNDLIEKLKDKNYVRAFGLMSGDEKKCFRKVGKKNCVMYSYTGWERTDGISYADISTYAIKPDYQTEPEPIDLEIVEREETKCPGARTKWLGVYDSNAPVELPHYFTHLRYLPGLEKFDDFWYQDSPGCKFFGIKETAIARCRFEGKKVFARFRV